MLDQQLLTLTDSQHHGAINQSTLTASKSVAHPIVKRNNDTLISQSMQLSEDDEEQVSVELHSSRFEKKAPALQS